MNANKICIQYIFQTEELSSRFTLTIFIISLIDINSLTASDRATYSAYVEAFVTHLCFLRLPTNYISIQSNYISRSRFPI